MGNAANPHEDESVRASNVPSVSGIGKHRPARRPHLQTGFAPLAEPREDGVSPSFDIPGVAIDFDANVLTHGKVTFCDVR
mmetsp:Transcript_9716/g.20147  ORF Transcript_9716/g.20147 Transcript_9716/m.20147 type:complete len:80 (-) Transcript_9716:888-1127(-)